MLTRRLLLALTVLATAAAGAATARTRDVWLNGIPPWPRAKLFGDTHSDYLDMSRPDAPWSKSASHLKVVETTGGLVLRESDETLQCVFADLKRRHIEFAVETRLLAGMDASGHYHCGRGVEGYGAPGTMTALWLRQRRLHATGRKLA